MKQTAMLNSKQLTENIKEYSICCLILGTFPCGWHRFGAELCIALATVASPLREHYELYLHHHNTVNADLFLFNV